MSLLVGLSVSHDAKKGMRIILVMGFALFFSTVTLCVRADSKLCEGDQRLLRLSSLAFPGTPWHDLWLRFDARFQKANKSCFELDLFINAEIGSEETALANVRRNRLQMAGLSLQGMATVVPELSVLLTPFLFDSEAEVDFVTDRYLTDLFGRLIEAKGLKLLQWSEVGWTQLYAKREIDLPEQAQGLKLRASNAIGSIAFAEAIQADSIPVTFAEALPALETGLIDGGQSGVGIYAFAGLSREATVINMTYHAFDTGLVVANLDWWDSLSGAQRELVMNSLDTTEEGRSNIRQALARIELSLPDQGVTVNYLSDAQRSAWQDHVGDVSAKIIEGVGGEAQAVFDAIAEGKAAFRSQRP
jgi:TRAP-type C4-dicarboxylate transport system substrate-binding protein